MERLTKKVLGFTHLKDCGNDFCKETCVEHDEEKSCVNCPIQKAFEKLAEYEDLEEQGKLLKLPVTVGDGAFRINKGAKVQIIPMEITEIILFNVGADKMSTQIKCRDYTYGGELHYLLDDIGKIVFLTKKEAEYVLQKMNEMEVE